MNEKRITEDQAWEIMREISNAKIDVLKFCLHFEVSCIHALKEDQLPAVYHAIELKNAQRAKKAEQERDNGNT